MSKRGAMVLAVASTLIGVITVVAQESARPPQPSPEHKKLAVFVGTWKDEAELKPGPFGLGGKMRITESCEWFTGGFSLVCNSESTGLVAEGKTLTVLNYDAEEKVYTYFELNNFGLTNSAKGTVDGDTWTFNGDVKIGGRLIMTRFTIKLPSPDAALMTTEISTDGGPWTPLMELKGTRVKQSTTDFNSCVPNGSEGWPFELFECYRRLGIRSPDWAGWVLHPLNPLLEEAFRLFKEIQIANGGNPYVGRTLKGLLWEAGFSNISISASYEIFDDPAFFVKWLANCLELKGHTELKRNERELHAWCEHPGTFMAVSWFEGLGVA